MEEQSLKAQKIMESTDLDVLWLNGYSDDCIIGYKFNDDDEIVLIYSIPKILKELQNDMTEEDAIEYFEFNVIGAYLGTQTPIFIYDEI